MNQIVEKEGINDARELGTPKYVILGVQHLFAMFGATVGVGLNAILPDKLGMKVKSIHGKEKSEHTH